MRIQPRASIAIGIVIAYAAIITAFSLLRGGDYDAIAASTSNALWGIVVPIGIGGAVVAAITTYLGWWRPALTERAAGPRWLLALPALFVVAGLGTLLSTDLGSLPPSLLLTLAGEVLLVGFAEEMVTRGVGLVGLRGSLTEGWSWFVSCALFGGLHALNALFGQSLRDTAVQIGFAFVMGSVLYVTRRVTGSLLWCMLLHAFWDFGTLTHGQAPIEQSAWSGLGLASWATVALTAAALLLLLRGPGAGGRTVSPDGISSGDTRAVAP